MTTQTQPTTPDPATPADRGRYRGAFPFWHEVGLAILLIATLAAAGSMEPRFLLPKVQLGLAGDAWPLAFLALPMTLIILTGGIDLSVGAMAALSAVTIGLLTRAGVPVFLAAAAGVAVGTLCGAFNGTLVAWLRIHPLIVTLATMAAFRGVALALTRGETIQGFSPGYGEVAAGTLLGLPYPLWLLAIAAIAVAVFLANTAYGRFVRAIGFNATAARYSGVPVGKMTLSLYAFSGFVAGVAAIAMTSRYGQAKADFATGLELEVITAVVLGGVSIFGGRGSLIGVLLGVLLIHELQKFVPWHWQKTELNALVVGALLIGSVLLNSLRTRGKRR